MVGPAVDLLANPLGAVRSLFSKACSTAAASASLPELSSGDWGVKAVFEKFLFEDGRISQVPQISNVSPDLLTAGSLVRFRGMVQDMFDVEYYVGAYKDRGLWQTNKYTDMPIGQNIDELSTEIWDRRLFYCVTVPGENQWVKSSWTLNSLPSSGESDQSLKRDHAAAEEMDCSQNGSESPNKRLKVVHAGANGSGGAEFGSCRASSCIIKIYDISDADLKLNDIAEFVGVLTMEPVVTTVSSDPSSLAESFMADDSAFQLPIAQVPRLHCITLRKLSAYSIPRQLCSASSLDTQAMVVLRESLVSKLQTVIGDDKLAAEYLLLHLMSKVHSRVEPLALGKLSLNFSGCQPGLEGSVSPLAAAVGQAISMLLPCSHVLPLSLENLNTNLFAPRKDYETNRLVTGALQVAGGTHLVLDETALNAGRLNETGMKNLQSLKGLLETQKVDYDFQYYQMQMPTDVPVLVVSCGKSRILPADAIVPIRCSSEAVQMRAEEAELSRWRMYLSTVREAEHIIEPSMHKILENDLVSARQNDRNIGPDTFHRWLTMARLLSLSFGERILTLERWEMMKNLESNCAARLRP